MGCPPVVIEGSAKVRAAREVARWVARANELLRDSDVAGYWSELDWANTWAAESRDLYAH